MYIVSNRMSRMYGTIEHPHSHHHYSTFQSYENNNGREKSVSGENRDGHVTIQGNVNGQPFYYDNAQPRIEPSSLALSRTTPSFRKNLPYNVSPYSNYSTYGGTRRRLRRRPRQTFRSKKKQQKRKGMKSNKKGKRKSKKSRK